MDFKEIKSKTEHELHTLLASSREKLRELRFKDSNRQLKNVREIRTVKQAIARVLTLLRKKKSEPATAPAEIKDLNK
ncbi:MAG: 50S ribosomal protein L29 [Candidatus Falkowbacteria bacterium]